MIHRKITILEHLFPDLAGRNTLSLGKEVELITLLEKEIELLLLKKVLKINGIRIQFFPVSEILTCEIRLVNRLNLEEIKSTLLDLWPNIRFQYYGGHQILLFDLTPCDTESIILNAQKELFS